MFELSPQGSGDGAVIGQRLLGLFMVAGGSSSFSVRLGVLLGSTVLVTIVAPRLVADPIQGKVWGLALVGVGLGASALVSLIRERRRPLDDETRELPALSSDKEAPAPSLEASSRAPLSLVAREPQGSAEEPAAGDESAELSPESRPSGTQLRGPLELDLVRAYRASARDRTGFLEFCRETGARVREMLAGDLSELRLRAALRTITARASLYELFGLADLANRLEESAVEGRRLPTGQELEELADYFGQFWGKLRVALDEARDDTVEVDFVVLDALLDRLRSGEDVAQITDELAALRNEPVEGRFRLLHRNIEGLAKRYGRSELNIELVAGDVRVARERFSGIWGALVHAIENALEHGIESPEERLAQGKPSAGKLCIRARVETNACILEIADDGRGIDWKKVTERARAERMPHVTREDLVEVLFAPGVSTRSRSLPGAGHGFGLLALRQACQELHGNVLFISHPGRGTTVRVSIPMRGGEIPFVLSMAPGPSSLRNPNLTRLEPKRVLVT